ncbi:uncharacterized protein LOC134293713 isoform X3 [Anolis carolinensis]|uniref:uncharacterized protein LOC134293713 isoform X3 n=1 Tax=Anolis carolinensis TaxID=28377 RepID=UPI002F2B8E78
MVPLDSNGEEREDRYVHHRLSLSHWFSQRGHTTLSGICDRISVPCIFKGVHYTVSCFNFFLLMVISVSPNWLVHPSGDKAFVMGFWTYCFHSQCDIIYQTTRDLNIVRTLLVIAILCSLASLVTSRALLMRCVQRSVPEGMISSIANFTAGSCVLACLVLTDMKLTTIMEPDKSVDLLLHKDFYRGCVSCSLWYLLGIASLLWYRYQLFLVRKFGIDVGSDHHLEISSSLPAVFPM